MKLVSPTAKKTYPSAHTVLLVIHIAYPVIKADRWTETREGMEIYTELDIVRGRAEDRRSEAEQAWEGAHAKFRQWYMLGRGWC